MDFDLDNADAETLAVMADAVDKQKKMIEDKRIQLATDQLDAVARMFVDALGAEAGMECLGQALLTRIADREYPGGWQGYIMYLNKISG